MKAENWEKLNGSGWGEQNPSTATPSPLTREVGTVEIPMFMYEAKQSVLVPAAVYRAQGVGRVKRAQHRWDKRVRHVVNGVFWFLVGVAGFAGVCNLALRLADLLGKMV